MKYLCMLYYDVAKFATLTQAQKEALGPLCAPYDKALRATGNVIVVGSLTDPAHWQCIRPRGGAQVTTSGMYVPVSEQAGAFMIIEAVDMTEAVKIASLHPAANVGEDIGFGVEVRACEYYG
jgi:hypothetical protein